MESIALGNIEIHIQNEDKPNWDYYIMDVDSHFNIQSAAEMKRKINSEIEDPERFLVEQEDTRIHVYSRQPDAAVQLARYLNEQKGTAVNDQEAEAVRKKLIALQK